jgi:type I site-specific restriction endonuclease
MAGFPNLIFPFPTAKRKVTDGIDYIWDKLRRRYLVLTPEEWVRQSAIAWLEKHCHVPALRITQEYPVSLNYTSQRADIVVMDNEAKPLLLVECKSYDIKLGDNAISQAVRYNSVVKARYIIITNGLRHFCFEQTESEYVAQSSFPHLG